MGITQEMAFACLGKSIAIIAAILLVAKLSPIYAAGMVLLFVAVCQHFDYIDMRNASIAEFAQRESANIADLLSKTAASTSSWLTETPIFSREPFFRYDIATVPERNYTAIDITTLSANLISAPFLP